MTDQLQEDIARGNAAQRLLDDELLKEVFDKLHAGYIEKWVNCNSRDVEGRERLWWAVRVVKEVQTDLHNIASGGRIARVQLNSET